MNTLETDIAILVVVLWLLAIVVILYDRYKYRKYYSRKQKFVFLRLNNVYARAVIAGSGINVCICAYNETNTYLFATDDGERVCGFSEYSTHLIADAAKKRLRVIDCGINIKQFVYEIKKLQEEYESDKS